MCRECSQGHGDSGEHRLLACLSRQLAETVWKILPICERRWMLPASCRQMRASSPPSPERKRQSSHLCSIAARESFFRLLQGRAKIFGRIFAELFFERRDGRKLGGIKTRERRFERLMPAQCIEQRQKAWFIGCDQ